MAKERLLLTVLLISVCIGCGPAPQSPPFFMSNALDKIPPRPLIRITVPAGPVKAKVREMMDCRVEVELLEGGVLPSTLGLSFNLGNRTVAGDNLQPLSFHGRHYYFRCTTRAPSRVGTYQLAVGAQYCIKPAGFHDDPKSRDVPLQILTFQESGPRVEVTR